MKRTIVVLCVAALLVGFSLSHEVLAGKGKGPAPKVLICHITDIGVANNGSPAFVGHVIEVSANAVPAHCAHGDHEPLPGNAVKGNDCKRRIGAPGNKKCAGDTPIDPPWFDL